MKSIVILCLKSGADPLFGSPRIAWLEGIVTSGQQQRNGTWTWSVVWCVGRWHFWNYYHISQYRGEKSISYSCDVIDKMSSLNCLQSHVAFLSFLHNVCVKGKLEMKFLSKPISLLVPCWQWCLFYIYTIIFAQSIWHFFSLMILWFRDLQQ